jgi:hypothetical protein
MVPQLMPSHWHIVVRKITHFYARIHRAQNILILLRSRNRFREGFGLRRRGHSLGAKPIEQPAKQRARCSACGSRGATIQHPGWVTMMLSFNHFQPRACTHNCTG